MKYTLEVPQNDTLEFDMTIVQSDGQPYTPSAGDLYFFKIDCKGTVNDVDIAQNSSHFKISRVLTPPGVYRFAGGIQFSNGDRRTVFKQEDCRLTVTPEIEVNV